MNCMCSPHAQRCDAFSTRVARVTWDGGEETPSAPVDSGQDAVLPGWCNSLVAQSLSVPHEL